MMSKHYSFVILHYCTIDDTLRCINSIKDNCRNSNYSIVVVDNASPNQSGSILYNKYENDSEVHVLINSDNLGFANGNNVGFKYAKEKLEADYIILCNNDTYLVQNNFINLIEEEYNVSKFAVLGPKIILKDNSINEVRENIVTIRQLKKEIRNKTIIYLLSIFYIDNIYNFFKLFIRNLLIKIKLKKVSNTDTNNVNIRQENIVLHGCFLIFSKNYIDLFDGIDDRTFLYLEEDLLAIRLKKYQLKSVYSPKLVICHDEDGATNSFLSNNRKKNIFVSKNWLKSSKIVLSELKRLEKK